jgi:hypothetical protein
VDNNKRRNAVLKRLNEEEVKKAEKKNREHPSHLRVRKSLQRGDTLFCEATPVPRKRPVRLLVVESLGNGCVEVIPYPVNDSLKLWEDEKGLFDDF